jgi:DedD protein
LFLKVPLSMPLPPFLQRFSRSAPASVQATLSASDIEQARTRARRRMIGMAVLVVVAVAVLSWLLESEPRPAGQDIRIVSAATAESSSVPAIASLEPAPKPAWQEPAPARPKALSPAKLSDSLDVDEELVAAAASKPEIRPETKPAPNLQAKPVAKPSSAPSSTTAAKPVPKPPAKPASKPVASPATVAAVASKAEAPAVRYVVQVGAFTEVTAARATRLKVEALGLKTYTQVVETPAGKKIRVRLGPFTSEADAQRALTTVRKAGVVGGILTM